MAAYRLLVPEGWALEGGVTKVGGALHMIPTVSDVTVRARRTARARASGACSSTAGPTASTASRARRTRAAR
ncbi:MAG: hypothetical protein H6828_13385 [Planctomycetes bacterium]|nr:hypothetical protein [Planctomycetota bacterium]